MENDTPIFPQEIITSILVRLPVKSLIRFQCVCKDWKNLFRTPFFIAEHLHHSTRQNPLLIVDSIISKYIPWHLRLLNGEVQVFECRNTHIIDPLMRGRVYSSNGLLCVDLRGKSQDSLWLWNPAIRVVRQVPKSLNNYEYECFSVGFGFSSIVNDYKIVKLFQSQCFVVHGQVYSLRTGLWREVEVGKLEGVYGLGCGVFPCNGCIFWVGHTDVKGHSSGRLGLIVSFDIAKEVFTLTPYPSPSLTPLEGHYNQLASYENKLAIFFPTMIEDAESDVFDLWVLEEGADPSKERWSWAKIYTSKPNPYRFIICPKIIWRNEIFCTVEALPEDRIVGGEDNHKGNVVLCNLTTNEFNFFDISRAICNYSARVLDFVESLVLLDNFPI